MSVFNRWFGKQDEPGDGTGASKGFLYFNLAVMLIVALLAFGEVHPFLTHMLALLYGGVYMLFLARLRCRGVVLFSTIAIWLCFVSSAYFEHDNRCNTVVSITATLGFVISAAMLVASALMYPAPSADPKQPGAPPSP